MVKVQLTVEVKGTMSGVVDVPADYDDHDLLIAADEQLVTLTRTGSTVSLYVSGEVVDDAGE